MTDRCGSASFFSGMHAITQSLTFRLATVLLAAACAGCGARTGSRPVVVEFWTTDHELDRMEVQRELALVFAEQYTNAPVRVDVVAVPENDLPKRLAAYQAAGRAPAVLRLGLEYASGYADEGILDRDAANETIRELGEDTFFAGPLALLRAADD